jgi:hypothetical protein
MDHVVIPRDMLGKLLGTYRRARRAEGRTRDNCETLLTLLMNATDDVRDYSADDLAAQLDVSRATAWREEQKHRAEIEALISMAKRSGETAVKQRRNKDETKNGVSSETGPLRETPMKQTRNKRETEPPPLVGPPSSPTPSSSPPIIPQEERGAASPPSRAEEFPAPLPVNGSHSAKQPGTASSLADPVEVYTAVTHRPCPLFFQEKIRATVRDEPERIALWEALCTTWTTTAGWNEGQVLKMLEDFTTQAARLRPKAAATADRWM